jgi:probable phosphoglycerate mutase
MPSGKSTRLLLVRHAESEANAQQMMQGWSDAPLSQRGEEQAQQLAQWFHANNPGAEALFASPLQRAYQTAQAVGESLGLPVQVRQGLRELGLGKLEDVDEATMITALQDPHFEQTYGVETLPVFCERVLGTLYGIMTMHEGGTLIVVAHGGVVGVVLSYWLDRDLSRTWTHYYTHNTAVNELIISPQQVELQQYNGIDHLDGACDSYTDWKTRNQ